MERQNQSPDDPSSARMARRPNAALVLVLSGVLALGLGGCGGTELGDASAIGPGDDTGAGDAREGEGWTIAVERIVQADAPTQFAMVFVHGFAEDPRATFLNALTNVYWPDLIAADEHDLGQLRSLSTFDVFAANHSGVLDPGLSVRDLADQVRIALEESPVFRDYDHIWLVAHGLGGILLQRTLVALDGRGRQPLVDKVLGITLLGVPANSTLLTQRFESLSQEQRLQVLRALFGAPARVLADLRPESVIPLLADTERGWHSFVVRRRETSDLPRIYCGYQRGPRIAGIFIGSELFSGTICDGGTHAGAVSHDELLQPPSARANIHVWLRQSIEETLRMWELSSRLRYPGAWRSDRPATAPPG